MVIYAIIVTYFPDLDKLLFLCKILNNSVTKIVIVDNSDHFNHFKIPECHIINLKENHGIANAQNIGINWSINQGAEVIVFFDQDSVISSSFLSNLLKPLNDIKIGVVIPKFFDFEKGFDFPSYRLNKFGCPIKISKINNTQPCQVDILISSGSAALVNVFEKIGLMDEDFFIDYVDIEWSMRCKKFRIPIFEVPTAIMAHSIGNRSLNFGLFRGFIHGEERNYYKIRNLFLLFRKKHVPFCYSCRELITGILHQSLQILFVKDKIFHIRTILSGIADGIKGKRGKRI